MTRGSGGGGYGSYPGGGSETILVVKGTGEPGDPQTVYYHSYHYRFNVSGFGGVFCRQAGVWIRIKRIHVDYDMAANVAGAQIMPILQVINAGTAGFTNPPVALGQPKTMLGLLWQDSADWDLRPDGFLFVVPPQTEVIGTPQPTIAIYAVGYNALDNARIFMEYEWGVWPETEVIP